MCWCGILKLCSIDVWVCFWFGGGVRGVFVFILGLGGWMGGFIERVWGWMGGFSERVRWMCGL